MRSRVLVLIALIATFAFVLAGTPAHGVVNPNPPVSVSIGTVAPTLGAQIQARAYGAALIEPAVRDVWGLETVSPPYTGSALVEWDYGLEEPFENVPPDGPDPHGRPRSDEDGMAQLAHFLETGEIIHTCDGPCVSSAE